MGGFERIRKGYGYRIFLGVLPLLVAIPGGNTTMFDMVAKECEMGNVSSTTLCLSTLQNTGVITVHREKINPFTKGIIAKISSNPGGNSEVTLVGANTAEYDWIAFAIADVAKGSMGKGGPIVICIIHRSDKIVRVNFLGTPLGFLDITEFSEAATSNKLGSNVESDYFKDMKIAEESFVGSKVISCNFSMSHKMWKLDGTVFDLSNQPFNVAFATGRVEDKYHILGDNTTLLAASHEPTGRFVSTSKYYLHRPKSDQSHIAEYLECGITDYCVGAGFDGCGATSFDCQFFVKFKRKGDTTLNVFLRGTTFKSFVGVGFSNSSNILHSHRLVRWNGLKFVAVCEIGSAPSILRINCTQVNDTDERQCQPSTVSPGEPQIVTISPVTKSTMINSNDEKVDVITCEFDLAFGGDDVDMMKKNGTRMFVGGDGKGSSEWLKLLRLFPVTDKSVFFSTSENSILLEEGKTDLPPEEAWQLIKQERLNFHDPENLDPRLNKSRRPTLSLGLVVQLCGLIVMVHFQIMSLLLTQNLLR